MDFIFILVFGVSFVVTQKPENVSAIQNCYFSDPGNQTYICQSKNIKGMRIKIKYIYFTYLVIFLRSGHD